MSTLTSTISACCGHSYGAFTAHALAGAELGPTMGIGNFRDPRVDAIVAIAPPPQGKDRYGFFDKGPDANSWKDVTIPSWERGRKV